MAQRIAYEKLREYMVADQADLANIPENAPVGTIAYTAGLTKIWQKDNDGTWKEV